MTRFATLVAATAMMLVFASPAMAQNPGATDATTPESAGQSQYQYGPDGPSTQQAIEQGIEDAIEDARENNAAVDGAEAYIESLSPEEAEAAEEAVEDSAGPSASERYAHLPDTGGPPILALPFAGAVAVFIAGGLLMQKSRKGR
ncbi:MAG: hypothetical protein H0U65_15660 [Rubrobacter sp.]|jgi:hypothetical protein|nr:hypothetical protein [Rubrobacter sp.]